MALHGCIEAGGTKVLIGLATDEGEFLATERIATTGPEETLGAATGWLEEAVRMHGRAHGPLSAIGIASFGPAGVDRRRGDWGFITSTPKPGWRDTDVAGPFARAFGVPVGFDTDVNGAAMAEHRWGAARGEAVAAYVTIGTGIGGGVVVEGRPLHGRNHPEVGHIAVRRAPADAGFAGICPFHGDCLEGLANGPAILARWGRPLSELPPDHPGHGLIAFYVAQLCIALEATVSPGRTIIGGGVAQAPGLLDRVRAEAERLAAGYFPGFDPARIVPPGLGERSGLLGALALARQALGMDG
ncbi:MAG: ROK family protein [Sphingobium sp.]